MQSLRIGTSEVHRVEESIWPVPGVFFPGVANEALEPYREWLVPRFFTPDWTLLLSMHAFVVRTRHHTVLIDSCVGNDKERAYPEWNHLQTDFLQRLAAVGAAPEQVDYVFCTHFHTDHVGWNTRLVNGRWEPTFPKARYLFHRPEFEYWTGLPEADVPVQVRDSVLPIAEAGRHELVDGDFVIDDELHLEPTPGHTPGHCSVHLGARGDEAVITGDMIHSPVQVAEPQWSSRACSDPRQAAETRTAFLQRYADTSVRVLGTHFNPPTVCRVVSRNGSLRPDFAG